MKIEKINENQIRCTLTKSDLADRQIKISELAYGTEKAKSLFRDMMQQAAYEFGFEAEDIPLMIEAIPLSADCIILVITKVVDPEELDTRFAKFSPTLNESDEIDTDGPASKPEGADEVLGLFKRIYDEKLKAEAKKKEHQESAKQNAEAPVKKGDPIAAHAAGMNLTKLYTFLNLDSISRVASVLGSYYTGENSLYKDASTGRYALIISKTDHTPEEFNKICNILSEYGVNQKYTSAAAAYYEEHQELIIRSKALQVLSQI
ncbi:adaptor protein MecA [Anaerobium acetethylicum]|uniref:Adapter protein MecA 1/2 n=1 Tax=Anaerobium acetethylicum TaxID=1619234 RepID=A0A1D3TRL1_9FIRM|nr:adaptor protein MecA [Anaerobium acetethylicum]SCP96332.1 adapter protein MecA 1/2 [Anaerobium acetethylicum]